MEQTEMHTLIVTGGGKETKETFNLPVKNDRGEEVILKAAFFSASELVDVVTPLLAAADFPAIPHVIENGKASAEAYKNQVATDGYAIRKLSAGGVLFVDFNSAAGMEKAMKAMIGDPRLVVKTNDLVYQL